MTEKSVWETLSALDVSAHIEKKGSLSYLSWAWAWGELMAIYPESNYEFDEPYFYENKTCEVWVTVTISGLSRKMWLPVMDYKNKAVPSPASRDISDTRMRCLVKCLAMFGLGHYIYAGEDVPSIPLVETISNTPVDAEKVIAATNFFIQQISVDADEDVVAPKIKVAYNRLTSDEQIAVNNNLKSEKIGKRQMNTILKGFLEWEPYDEAAA
jgi:hypothetical protein